MKKEERYRLFTEVMWHWYSRHKRTLPWRDLTVKDRNQRAYMILVSEVMLQQTQVPRVIPAFTAFLERFPTLDALAKAGNKDILMQWRGMGYNSRALRLRDAAKTIVTQLNGKFPDTMEGLQSIKGIGPYTAAAIRNFAFDIPTPCIDTNIRRILHRAFIGPENADGTWEKDDKYLLQIAKDILEIAIKAKISDKTEKLETKNQPFEALRPSGPNGKPITREWHAALMDFGSLVCTRRSPKWDICPLTKNGLMTAAYKTPVTIKKSRKEPGRLVGSTFIPNRIFRGRIVEVLRDSERGLTATAIGPLICKDWSSEEQAAWLDGLLKGLIKDEMLVCKAGKYELRG